MIFSVSDILFTFCFFSLMGWCLEVIYRSIRDRHYINPGLLKGPYLVLYGVGALVLIQCIAMVHESNLFVKILVYFLATTTLELFSSLVARHVFHAVLWDYSDQRFNWKGHICLKFSVYWIILAFIFEYVLFPPFVSLLQWLPFATKITVSLCLMTVMLVDFAWVCGSRLFPFRDVSKRVQNNLQNEFLDLAGQLLKSPELQKLSQYPHHRQKTRLDHVMEVAWLSFLWGKRFSLDCKAIVRGALLHDLFFYDWLHEGPRLHGFRHHNIALENARSVASLSSKEEDIIRKHMWPLTIIPPRYLESFIVCFMDTFCSVRDYFGNSTHEFIRI